MGAARSNPKASLSVLKLHFTNFFGYEFYSKDFINHIYLTAVQIEALLCGEYRELPEDIDLRSKTERSIHGPSYSFHRRDLRKTTVKDRILKKQELFNVLDSILRLGIHSRKYNANDNKTDSKYNEDAVTIARWNKTRQKITQIWIYLTYESMAPLFRNDLSRSERLAEQFCCANHLLHEFAVSISHLPLI